ncbi:MAG: 5'/3'-nucleotidase SurE [Candidatus Marinimicrobia bacterium]|nr:5'/3'-nucleotidase SurE [Candidatus Neomarinimicrobiota bacterium]|tara:strand:- start:3390 stop:4154 length:765 start_codon:yes stop_codon:yes gene_type:complete
MIKPKILITNDDGILSQGIYALWEAMNDIGETFIAAPSSEQSASSHSLTLSSPLRVEILERKNGFKGWSINGTPVDCVKIAIRSLMKKSPDILVSGVNHGANLGNNIIYSGTVSAATEGMIMGVPSIAISLASYETDNYDVVKKYAKNIVTNVLDHGLPQDTLLNVNVPYCKLKEIRGLKITSQGNQYFIDEYEKRIDPRNSEYYWIKGQMIDEDQSIDYDGKAIQENYVSVTPIHFKLTNELYKKDLKKIISA